MKEQVIPLLLSIVATLLNYIFISTISAKSQQQTVQDFKTVLNFMLEEVKTGQDSIRKEIAKSEEHILNEIKQSTQKQSY